VFISDFKSKKAISVYIPQHLKTLLETSNMLSNEYIILTQ